LVDLDVSGETAGEKGVETGASGMLVAGAFVGEERQPEEELLALAHREGRSPSRRRRHGRATRRATAQVRHQFETLRRVERSQQTDVVAVDDLSRVDTPVAEPPALTALLPSPGCERPTEQALLHRSPRREPDEADAGYRFRDPRPPPRIDS
jgi:hypothetical protein